MTAEVLSNSIVLNQEQHTTSITFSEQLFNGNHLQTKRLSKYFFVARSVRPVENRVLKKNDVTKFLDGVLVRRQKILQKRKKRKTDYHC